MVNQTRSKKKLKHIHFSSIILVKLVISAGKKDRKSKAQLFKALVISGSSESILAKTKVDKLPVKKELEETTVVYGRWCPNYQHKNINKLQFS